MTQGFGAVRLNEPVARWAEQGAVRWLVGVGPSGAAHAAGAAVVVLQARLSDTAEFAAAGSPVRDDSPDLL